MLHRLAAILVIAASLIWGSAQAQILPKSDAGKNQQQSGAILEIERLVGDLDEDEAEVLTRSIKILTKHARQSDGQRENVNSGTDVSHAIGQYVRTMYQHVSAVPGMVQDLRQWLSSEDDAGEALITQLLKMGLAVTVGFLAEAAIAWFIPGKWQQETLKTWRLAEGMGALSQRLLVHLFRILVFAVSSYLVIRLLFAGESLAVASGFLFYVFLFPRIVAEFLRFFLSPTRPDLRMVAADDRVAGRVHNQLGAVIAGTGFVVFLVWLLQTKAYPQVDAFRFVAGFTIVVLVSLAITRNRNGLTDIIVGDKTETTPGLVRMAEWWPGIAILLIVVDWLTLQFMISTGYPISGMQAALTLVIVLSMPFFDTAIRGIVRQAYKVGLSEEDLHSETHRKIRLGYIRFGRVALIAFFFYATGLLWGFSFSDVAEIGVGAQLARNAVSFSLTVLVGYLLWEFTSLWINQVLARETSGAASSSEDMEGGGATQSRLASVLPLFRVSLQILIVVLTFLIAASQLGINITPLLAGAGVVGIALGFGAQTLVRDIVSGVFFLLDDAFRLGEYLDIEGTVGTVEKISIRSLQLRHHLGTVHIIPYGEIPKISNRSRDWVMVKLKFTVPFETDLEKVRKLFKKIGQQMYEDNEYYAENIIQPFKLQGVYDVDDVGIVVRGKFMAKPGTQFMIRKEIYKRVQHVFDENSIPFARKEVRVQIPGLDGDGKLTPQEREAVAGAAIEAAETKRGA